MPAGVAFGLPADPFALYVRRMVLSADARRRLIILHKRAGLKERGGRHSRLEVLAVAARHETLQPLHRIFVFTRPVSTAAGRVVVVP